MNNGETWMERNDTVKEGEEDRQMWGCSAAAAFTQERLLIIRRLCEIAIYDLQAHSPIFVQMLGIIHAMLYIFCPKENKGSKRETLNLSALQGFSRGSISGSIFSNIQVKTITREKVKWFTLCLQLDLTLGWCS